MYKLSLLMLMQLICCALPAQHFSVANEKQNIFYLGVDNPVSISVENTEDKQLIVRTDNGSIKRMYGGYIYRGNKVGKAAILLYKKVNGKLKEIGRSEFRVKSIPLPVFKFGPSGPSALARPFIPKSQMYARVESEDFDYDAQFRLDSFKVCIISGDTCQYVFKTNIGNKISEEVADAFHLTKPGDTIIFKSIVATGSDGIQIQLEPCILFVKEE